MKHNWQTQSSINSFAGSADTYLPGPGVLTVTGHSKVTTENGSPTDPYVKVVIDAGFGLSARALVLSFTYVVRSKYGTDAHIC